jgi:GTP-binding protein
MFHDKARIHVTAGRGGDGALSFRREKYVPKGGPDGGDGGRGGDVVLLADPDRRDLSAFRPNQHVKAQRGGSGRGALKHGAEGNDAELHVPIGTQVFDEEERLIADLAHAGARAVVARGGTPGRGNKRFATPTRQTPRFAETGLPGEEGWIELRLKLLADAALVGFPNAGKSSLLRRISNAKPKVADYPFTTIAPVLGTVEAADGRQLTVADVPGLIEGASEGVGLGHEFLAHLERARLLVHVVDVTEDVRARFDAIDRELEQYGAGLAERPQILALNKIDLVPEPPEIEIDDPRVLRTDAISCATGAGIEDLKRGLFELCPAAPEPEVEGEDEIADFLVYRPRPPARRTFRIFRTDRGFRVAGTPPTDEAELDAALKAAGARKGSTVEVEGEEFEIA